jgi:ubiquinone/menaquinone biosynthesis C-methylase UbiE
VKIQSAGGGERSTEAELMQRLLPIRGARVLELGCGRAIVTRLMVETLGAASVTATEVDGIQHEKNLQIDDLPGVTFRLAGAEATGEPDEGFDIVVMLKSLHHVPVDRMDQALREIRRVLRPGGLAYISEPVYAGAFNDILRLFNDEQRVREVAFSAVERAVDAGLFELVDEVFFQNPASYESWETFEERILGVTHSEYHLDAPLYARVKRAFLSHMGPQGAEFFNPMRVDLLRRPAA